MHLVYAIVLAVVRSALIVVALMTLLFGGYLALAEGNSSLQERLETPERLAELDESGVAHAELIGQRQAESVAGNGRRQALDIRLGRERSSWEAQLDDELREIEDAAQEQIAHVDKTVQQSRSALNESMNRTESRYCESWNPIDWWTCRQVRQRSAEIKENAGAQRQAVEYAVNRMQDQAREDAERHRTEAVQRFDQQTADFQDQLDTTMTELNDLDAQREALDEEIARIQAEEAMLRAENWLWIELRKQWVHLLIVAVLIFLAPFIRRTLWYFVGMPLVSSAGPIHLSESRPKKKKDAKPGIECGDSERMLVIDVPAGRRLLARPGYIQSDRQGAKSEIFFDRHAPNLSYMTGLVLLTRLESREPDDEPRKVMLGTPDDPDAYLMRIELEDHPGIVLRASHVVSVIGDIEIDSIWRLGNLHAWATSQIRFIVFSGTGTLVLEGYGDVQGRHLEDDVERKRMHLVVGFDTRLSYHTERSATFLPYLVDPAREPLVVDVFEGTGTIFFEKNPSARKRHRTTGEAIAGFFLDAFRKLLGL